MIPQTVDLRVHGALQTDRGQRPVNEDWCGSIVPGERGMATDAPSVWVIADGVTAYGTGREAAHLAVETVLGAGWDRPGISCEEQIALAVQRANTALWERGRGTGQGTRTLAATIVAAVVQGADLWIAGAGNCRAYLLQSGAIRQITRDHTLAAEAARQGRLQPEEAARHAGRPTITRCLGSGVVVQPDFFHERLVAGDRILLCSDGLTLYVTDEELRQIGVDGEPEAVSHRLIELANQRGGSDNLTVGLVELLAPSWESPTTGLAPAFEDLGEAGLRLLQDLSRRLNTSLEPATTLRSVLNGLVDITRAERACIMLADDQTGELVFGSGRNLGANDLATDSGGSQHIVAAVFQSRRPLLIGDAVSDPAYRAFESVVAQSIRSVMCAPLLVRDTCVGVVYADNSLVTELFTQADLDLLVAFASLAATAIDNARLHDRLDRQYHQISTMKTAQDRILRSISSAIIALDRDGQITNCNRAASELLVVEVERLVGMHLGEVLPPHFLLALGPPFGGAGRAPDATIQGLEMAGELPNRGLVHFQHRLSPLRDELGKTLGYVLVLEDRTELKRLDDERRQAASERERLMRTFGNTMSPDVLQEVLRLGVDGAGMSGRRRDLTIMFADIRGITGLAERLAPREFVEILNTYLGTATDVILQHRGSIDKFMGDAVMALFGAPAPLENHALQAVKAAKTLQRRFAEAPPLLGLHASIGIGINSGTGVVGMIGSPNLRSYTVIGDVVNVAARLESQARAGEVLITEDTYERVADNVEVEPLGSMFVKGRVSPVSMYKVLAVDARPDASEAPTCRGREGVGEKDTAAVE